MIYFRWRQMVDRLVHVALSILVFFALLPLLSVFLYVIQQGAGALSWDFFVNSPAPVGESGGGFFNALFGSGILVLMAGAMGIPWGVACGICLSEYRRTRTATYLRFATDVLTGVPSIIVGMFVYAVVVIGMGRFSGFAGSVALTVIMIPTIARTTEEILKLVPDHVREAGLALGLPRWKVIIFIVLRGSLSGVVTGIMLAIARAAGETAPLLFTAFNNRYVSTSVFEPMATLPVQIYTYAISPFEDWHRQAWAGALVLVVFVFLINVVTRWLLFDPNMAKRVR